MLGWLAVTPKELQILGSCGGTVVQQGIFGESDVTPLDRHPNSFRGIFGPLRANLICGTEETDSP